MIHDGSLVIWFHGFHFKYILFLVVFAGVGCTMTKMMLNSEFWLRIIIVRKDMNEMYEAQNRFTLTTNTHYLALLFVASKMFKTSIHQWIPGNAKPFFRTTSSSRGNAQIFFCFFSCSVPFLFHCRYSLQRTDHIMSHDMFCQ